MSAFGAAGRLPGVDRGGESAPPGLLVSGWKDAARFAWPWRGWCSSARWSCSCPRRPRPAMALRIWAMLVSLYGLGVLLMLLGCRPRLSIYKISSGNNSAPCWPRWPHGSMPRAAGPATCWPCRGRGCSFRSKSPAKMRNVTLSAVGSPQDYEGCARLEQALREALGGLQTGRNPRGAILLIAGLAMLGLLGLLVGREVLGLGPWFQDRRPKAQDPRPGAMSTLAWTCPTSATPPGGHGTQPV